MLIKEYRIPLPLTVEEYRIAQLYMIAKKSREESHGTDSGVEIIVNEPYTDGPGGSGQYTRKIYHVGSHLPGWIKSLLPKSALTVEEEAWNAYPYTKTRYTCPFVEKFSLEIETYYFADDGHQDNVFKLSGSDLRNRAVDLIDIVKDQVGADYVTEEDPTQYKSGKTGRGPLNETWLVDYWNEVKGKKQPTEKNMALMCAYKLCRVEFRYWGMQTKLEKFIHDVALRKTMLRAHRQAWAWQDEWYGLTMDDIREIERQTQLALQRKMGSQENSENDMDDDDEQSLPLAIRQSGLKLNEPPPSKKQISQMQIESDDSEDERKESNKMDRLGTESVTKGTGHSSMGSTHSFDLQVANWRLERLEVDSKSGSEEEFFDCVDNSENASLAKCNSLELLAEEEDSPPADNLDDSIFSQSFLKRVASERSSKRSQFSTTYSIDRSESPPGSPGPATCPTSCLVLVLHAGSVLDGNVDSATKKSDLTTFRGAFESVMRQHYPSLHGHVALKLVSCPPVCTDTLSILSSLSPYSFSSSPSCIDTPNLVDLPIGSIPLIATCGDGYQDLLNRTIQSANNAYFEFLKSDEGRGFSGQIDVIGDAMGSVLAYDILCRSSSNRHGSEGSGLDVDPIEGDGETNKWLNPPSPRRRSSSTASDSKSTRFEFDVNDFFMLGSPLPVILAARRLSCNKSDIRKPLCAQLYNLFHPTDPLAIRIEPLLSARFSSIPPVNIPRYIKYPLGNGTPYHLLELIQSCPTAFSEPRDSQRKNSTGSIQSNLSGSVENVPLSVISKLQCRWWGSKRIDYALYCPDGLSNFPAHALPHLFHASFWESSDVIAFILRQIGRYDTFTLSGHDDKESTSFRPGQPREKWMRKRTSIKIKNVTANHRANDVIVKDGEPQRLIARFMYGPLDMITLTGEKVDVHIMKDAPAGEWILYATEVTDRNGRISYTVPESKALGYGIYPVKMVVRGDHTAADFYLAVIPSKTECVVFSIDGSFTASMSVTGRDPKVRAGAVDVCRHWQELGYLLIYVTGRPDMQQHKVVSWLSQHNFPHGLISFADGLSTDPLGHKTAYLNNLINNHGVVIHSAYGSNKDISVYTNIGLKPKQIYIVGKVNKKLQSSATVLSEGYATHLSTLMTHGGSRPAQGNGRMVIPRGCFNLPGHLQTTRRISSDLGKSSSPMRKAYVKRKGLM